MFKPSVVFLAFANDSRAFLPALKEESEEIYTTLLPVEENKKSIVVRREESVENNDINYYLGRYRDRLAIFHYAGHAESKILAFEDKEGNADGLANLLGLQKHLKVVFLNACSTKEQAFLYIRAGVKAVIATSLPVVDSHAKLFSTTFYQYLASDHTIEEAYIAAIGVLKQNFERYGEHKNAIVLYENVFGKKESTPKATETTPSEEVEATNQGSLFESTPEIIIEKKDETVEEKEETTNNVHFITRKLVRRGHKPDDKEIPWRLYVNADHSDVLQWKITEPPIKEYLQEGSEAHFNKLLNIRFSYINFDRKVYANNEQNEVEEINLPEKVASLWKAGGEDAFITGKGGTGKTTNMVRIWKHFVKKSKDTTQPIPLYISLSEYNEGEYERNFIIYQIGEHYLNQERLSDDVFNQIFRILHDSTIERDGKELPAFVLFLDGLDEITVEHQQLLDEISELSQEAKGVQVIITNTEPLKYKWAKNFKNIELMPSKVVFSGALLESSRFSSSSLDGLLQNPMMAELYKEGDAVINRNLENRLFEFKLPVTTRGELFWNSFEVEIAKKYEQHLQSDFQPYFFYHFKFMSRHFLPYIAFLMEKASVISFNEEQLQNAINIACGDIYQRHFLKTFKEFRRDFSYFNLDAPNWVKEEERFEILSAYLVDNFVMFIKEGTRYKFSHQMYRDFLAAVHIQNNIVLSLKKEALPPALIERKLATNSKLYLLLGELEGEHYNYGDSVSLSDTKTLLEKTLEYCRNIFDKRKLGYVVWNILNIWSELRGQLSGLDLSALDLRGFSLNGVKLQSQSHLGDGSVCFNNTLIDREVFLGKSERGRVLDVSYSKSLSFPMSYMGYGKAVVLFAIASSDGTVKVWETASRKCFDVFDEAKCPVTAVEFLPCGQYVAGVSKDGFLRIWNLKEDGLVFEIQAHNAPITSLSISDDGTQIATCSEDKTIKIWKKEGGDVWMPTRILKGHSKTIECVAFSSDGNYLVSGAWDRSIRLWDLQLGEIYWVKKDHVSVVNDVAFSPDGKSVLSGSSDDTILEWTLSDGKVQQKYFDHHQGVNSVNYSPDGRYIVSGSSDETIKIWERATGDCIQTLRGHHFYVNSVMFSPDGEHIISGSADGTAKIWELETYSCIQTFSNHNGLHVQGIDFRDLHQDSHLPSSDKGLLRQYGAIFNNEDEQIWHELVNRLCYLYEDE
jgi:WD40 repeat protein